MPCDCVCLCVSVGRVKERARGNALRALVWVCVCACESFINFMQMHAGGVFTKDYRVYVLYIVSDFPVTCLSLFHTHTHTNTHIHTNRTHAKDNTIAYTGHKPHNEISNDHRPRTVMVRKSHHIPFRVSAPRFAYVNDSYAKMCSGICLTALTGMGDMISITTIFIEMRSLLCGELKPPRNLCFQRNADSDLCAK